MRTCLEKHELRHLPFGLESQLLRLPPATEGEYENALVARGWRRLPESRVVQLSDIAGRSLHDRPRRRRHGKQDQPGSIVMRHSRGFLQYQP